MKGKQVRFLRLRSRVNAALDSVNTSYPDQSWNRASRHLKRARDTYNSLAVGVGEIAPPDELKRVHSGMAKSLQLLGLYLDAIQDALSSRDVSLLVGASNHSSAADRAIELRANWRTAVTIYAHTLNVNVPAWVQKVGTRG